MTAKVCEAGARKIEHAVALHRVGHAKTFELPLGGGHGIGRGLPGDHDANFAGRALLRRGNRGDDARVVDLGTGREKAHGFTSSLPRRRRRSCRRHRKNCLRPRRHRRNRRRPSGRPQGRHR